MKKIYSWIGVLVVIIFISTILFITGKQHKVFVVNGKKGDKNIPKTVEYSIDGSKFKKVRATKKGAIDVKGKNHVLVIKYQDSSKKEIEVTKEFQARIDSVENIDLFRVINDQENWIEYEKADK